LRRPIPLYLPPGGLQVVEHIVAAYGRSGNGRLANPFTSAFAPVELSAGQPVLLGDMAVIPYAVQHTLPAFGFRVDVGQPRLHRRHRRLFRADETSGGCERSPV
jgi:hypothetical protein